MCPAPDQPPGFLFIYLSTYIILSLFKHDYTFDQQELLIRTSYILVSSCSDAGTKDYPGRCSRYPSPDITPEFLGVASFLRIPLIKPYKAYL
jgi:hypothetical protein